MLEVAEARDRGLLSPSAADPALPRDSRNFYSLATPDDKASSTIATFAARRLGVHQNTVAYRVRQAEDILGHSLKERRFEVGGIRYGNVRPICPAPVSETWQIHLPHQSPRTDGDRPRVGWQVGVENLATSR